MCMLLQHLAQLVKGNFCCNSLLNRKSLECDLTAKQRVHWVIESSADGASPATATADQSGNLSLDVKSNVVRKDRT
ncbi:hypothetical protein P3L10_014811 [Capsicum annuum]